MTTNQDLSGSVKLSRDRFKPSDSRPNTLFSGLLSDQLKIQYQMLECLNVISRDAPDSVRRQLIDKDIIRGLVYYTRSVSSIGPKVAASKILRNSSTRTPHPEEKSLSPAILNALLDILTNQRQDELLCSYAIHAMSTYLLSTHTAQEIVYALRFPSLLLDVLQPEIRFCMKHRVRHSSITQEQDPSKQLSSYLLSCQLRDSCLLAIYALSLTDNPLFDFLMSVLPFVERIAICGGETEQRVDYFSTTETHLMTISTQQATPSFPSPSPLHQGPSRPALTQKELQSLAFSIMSLYPAPIQLPSLPYSFQFTDVDFEKDRVYLFHLLHLLSTLSGSLQHYNTRVLSRFVGGKNFFSSSHVQTVNRNLGGQESQLGVWPHHVYAPHPLHHNPPFVSQPYAVNTSHYHQFLDNYIISACAELNSTNDPDLRHKALNNLATISRGPKEAIKMLVERDILPLLVGELPIQQLRRESEQKMREMEDRELTNEEKKEREFEVVSTLSISLPEVVLNSICEAFENILYAGAREANVMGPNIYLTKFMSTNNDVIGLLVETFYSLMPKGSMKNLERKRGKMGSFPIAVRSLAIATACLMKGEVIGNDGNGIIIVLKEMTKSNDTETKTRALWSIACIAENKLNFDQLWKDGVIPQVISIASSPDKELALAAVYVLWHLSNGPASQTRLLVSGNCIPPLRQIVTALPPLQHLYACPPVFPKVVQQTPLTKGQKPASTTTQIGCGLYSILVVKNLVRDNPDSIQPILDSGMVQKIIRFIVGEKAFASGSGIDMNFSGIEGLFNDPLSIRMGCLHTVCLLLQGNKRQIKQMVEWNVLRPLCAILSASAALAATAFMKTKEDEDGGKLETRPLLASQEKESTSSFAVALKTKLFGNKENKKSEESVSMSALMAVEIILSTFSKGASEGEQKEDGLVFVLDTTRVLDKWIEPKVEECRLRDIALTLPHHSCPTVSNRASRLSGNERAESRLHLFGNDADAPEQNLPSVPRSSKISLRSSKRSDIQPTTESTQPLSSDHHEDIARLIQQLHSSNQDEVNSAIEQLRLLSKQTKNESLRHSVIINNGVDILVALMKTSKDSITIAQIVEILLNCTAIDDPIGSHSVAYSGFLDCLDDLIRIDDAVVSSNVVWCLANIASESDILRRHLLTFDNVLLITQQFLRMDSDLLPITLFFYRNFTIGLPSERKFDSIYPMLVSVFCHLTDPEICVQVASNPLATKRNVLKDVILAIANLTGTLISRTLVVTTPEVMNACKSVLTNALFQGSIVVLLSFLPRPIILDIEDVTVPTLYVKALMESQVFQRVFHMCENHISVFLRSVDSGVYIAPNTQDIHHQKIALCLMFLAEVIWISENAAFDVINSDLLASLLAFFPFSTSQEKEGMFNLIKAFSNNYPDVIEAMIQVANVGLLIVKLLEHFGGHKQELEILQMIQRIMDKLQEYDLSEHVEDESSPKGDELGLLYKQFVEAGLFPLLDNIATQSKNTGTRGVATIVTLMWAEWRNEQEINFG
ncbi:hypothetical protein BLNAU_15959 [Blattamonas nauphoetae]|uniref:Uncharacterized protein n=1 Tax=Blattamonas nauphoetae TaxID=2049346 RepID=A0ABQ9X968_9EUKA|nr:hypothetical protein BLNAU_15959 [Blattamonas nauphoetae]